MTEKRPWLSFFRPQCAQGRHLSMDLQAEERYSLAALVTLALHQAHEVDAAVTAAQTLWGEPPWLDESSLTSDIRLKQSEWDAFWGWDLIGPGGLLERIYDHLVPASKWAGLKQLPLVGSGCGGRVPLGVIRGFVQVIDAELAASLPAPAKRGPRQQQQPQQQQQGSDANLEAAAAEEGGAAHLVGHLPSEDDRLLLQGAAPPELNQAASPRDDAIGSSAEGTPTAELRLPVGDYLFDGLFSESDDSDWEEDMRREHLAAAAASGYMPAVDPSGSPAAGQVLSMQAAHEQQQLPQLQKLQEQPGCSQNSSAGTSTPAEPSQRQHEGAQPRTLPADGSSNADLAPQAPCPDATSTVGSEFGLPAPANGTLEAGADSGDGSLPRSTPGTTTISHHALGALLELLYCCVGMAVAPAAECSGGSGRGSSAAGGQPADGSGGNGGGNSSSSEGSNGAAQQGEGGGGEDTVCQRGPQLRWYDARARVALKQVAAWLQVPWSKVANFELLLANQKAPAAEKGTGGGSAPAAKGDESGSGWRWVKVGAAAVGGGALFAVTGGLAAPALAAGLGSVMTLVGGSAAAAGTVSGFLASTSGVVTVASALGAAGATSTGSRMAHRTAGVTEFGFRELLLPQLLSRPASALAVDGDGGSSRNGSGAAAEADAGMASAAGAAAEREGVRGSSVLEDGAEEAGVAAVEGTQAGASSQPDSGHLLLSAATMGAPRGLPRPSSSYQSSNSGSLPAAGDAAAGSSNWSSKGGKQPTAPSSSGSLAKHPTPSQPPAAATAAGAAAPLNGSLSAASIPSSSGRSSPAPSTSAGTSAAATPASAASLGPPSSETSAWQRWFGKKQEEPPLLPAPLRIRSAGDVKLSAVVCISGWITSPQDYVAQWEGVVSAPDADQFTLVWESRELLALNSVLGTLLAKQAASQGAQFAVQHLPLLTGGAVLLSAVAPVLLLDTASGLLIGNAWAIALERAAKAGKVLAHVLMERGHGDRPVSLVGHSMGARLIFFCLLELCRHNCRGIVEQAVLLGAPVNTGRGDNERWHMARRAVAGRLVNAYSRSDWVLGTVYAGSSGFVRAAAGLCPVEGVAGVENVNLTALVPGHFSYLERDVLAEVMEAVAVFD